MVSCYGEEEDGDKEGKTKLPSPEVIVGTSDIPIVQGGYCYYESGGRRSWNECADSPSIPEILEGKKPTVVSKNTDISINFVSSDKPSDIYITQMKENEDKVSNQELETPSEPGIYYYDIFVRWDDYHLNADSSYAFVIEIK